MRPSTTADSTWWAPLATRLPPLGNGLPSSHSCERRVEDLRRRAVLCVAPSNDTFNSESRAEREQASVDEDGTGDRRSFPWCPSSPGSTMNPPLNCTPRRFGVRPGEVGPAGAASAVHGRLCRFLSCDRLPLEFCREGGSMQKLVSLLILASIAHPGSAVGGPPFP